jgi:hypothetical protein
MDEQQLQLLYGDYAKDKGFKDYNEFKSLMSNESSRKVFFDESNKDLGFKDYEEMNSLLKVKKKADSSGVSSTSNGQGLVSETPSGSLGGQKSDKLWEQPIDNTLDFTQNLNLQGIPKNSSLDESVVSKIKSHFPKTEPTKKEIRNDINNNIVTESTRVQKPKQTTLKDIEKEKEIIGNILNLEVPKLRSATAVTAQENSEIESDLVSKKEQSGIWNNIKAYGKTAINKAQEFVWGMTDEGTTPQELIINKDPLKEEKKQSKKELIENGLKNPTDIEINENADKIFIKNKQDAIKQQKYQDYIETLDDNKKTLLEVDAHIRFKTIGKESNDISNRILGNKKAIQDLDNLLNNPNINQQDKDLILKDKQNIEIQNQKDFASYTKKLDDLGSAEEEFDALKRNYGAIYNFTERVQNSIHNVGLGLVSAVGFAQKYNGNPFGELMNLQAQEYVSTQKENLEKRKEFLRPDNKELTLSNFVQYSTDLIANQSGTLIAIGTTGGVGGAAILGASQVGETANEMHNDMKQGAIYTPEQVAIAPILSGLSTAILSELPTGKTLASSGRIFASAFKSESGKVILKEATKKTTQGILNEIGKNYKREIPTELLDNIIQNTIKKDILGDTSVGYFDNSLQTLQDTALMTSLFSLSAVPHVTGYAINKYTPKEKLNELKENAKKIIELKSSITTDLSPLIKQEIEKTITKTTKKSTDIINNTFENIGKMNPENAQKILDNEKKKNNIKETAKEIQSNTEITDDSKKILLADLKIEHSLISEESESIITENQQTVEQSTKEPVEVENNEQPIEKEVAPSVSLSKEDITEIHDKINNTTNVVIREKNIDGEGYFAFPNEGVFGEVEKVGVKDNATAYTYSNDFKIKDLHSEGVVFDDYMKDVDVKQLRKDGFDAVSVMEIDGSKVLHILKPEKLTLLDNRLPDLRKNNVNLQPENNLENGNTETNKRTESDSVQKNSTINTEKKIDSRKRGVGEKPKFLKEKISFNQRKVKDKTMLTALDHEAVDFYDLLQQALIGGVKLTPDALKEVIASKNSIGKEVQSRMQYIRTAEKGGISFNDLVHQIFETALEKFNDADIRNELIEILKNNTTTKQMALEYTDRHDLHQKDKEGNRINEDGEILYETQYGLLTNAEIEDIYTFEKEQT